MTSLLLIGLPVLAEQGRTNMGFEKLTKMIIVKVLSLFFWNHFVKIVGCLINLYKFRGRKFWSGCKNSSKNDEKIVKWKSGEGYMIYIRVCNSACLALFDLEGLGACLLNLDRRTFRCSVKKHRKNCECCPGHYLIVNHYILMSWFKFRDLPVIDNCVVTRRF